MNAPDDTVRYRERGAGMVPLLWGPAFALVGFVAELATGGAVHGIAWVVVGLVLLMATALWVYARRRFLAVTLTTTTLWQGRDPLPLPRIAKIIESEPPTGARVLGGGFTVPRKYDEVPLRLDDDSVVLAWARDGAALRAALREALTPGEDCHHE